MRSKMHVLGGLVCLFLATGLPVNLSAQETDSGFIESSVPEQAVPISQNDVSELNGMSDPKSVQSAADDMEDWFEDVLRQFNLNSFGEDNGKFVLSAAQSVSLKPTDPQYGDALVNAFDKAMMKLQGQYLMIRFGKTTTEKIKSFYSDRSTDAKDIALPPETDPGYLDKVVSILNKGLDVTEKKLDKELLELGVEPQEVAKMTPKQKKDIFRDKFVKTTLRKASGSIAGLFPIQTNVITDPKGRTVVGVVAVASPKTIQVARDISLQRTSLIAGKGRDITTLLPATGQEFIGTLGVRLAYDLDGTPAIISYGISSYRPDTGNDYIDDELKEEAKADAISNADAQIAEIVNGVMSEKNERVRGEEIKTFVEKEMRPDSDSIEKTINNIIKITSNSAKSSASIKLQGISTVKTWRHTVENGQKFVGAVRVWKYSTLAAVNSFDKPQPKAGRSDEGGKRTHQPFQQSSKPVNKMDDF